MNFMNVVADPTGAVQLIHRQTDQLAANDAEIAELRKCLDECDKLRAYAVSMHENAVQQNGNLSIKLAQCVLQRDEARECVGRLCGALRNAAANSRGPDRAAALAALAATPEHLRG